MTRKLQIYTYKPFPAQLPPSKHKTGFIDALDASIEGLMTPEILKLMEPIGHPHSTRFVINQYKASQALKVEANTIGNKMIAEADDFTLMSALKRVAYRRGITPRQLLISVNKATAAAAE